jgi:hypothetical protein
MKRGKYIRSVLGPLMSKDRYTFLNQIVTLDVSPHCNWIEGECLP